MYNKPFIKGMKGLVCLLSILIPLTANSEDVDSRYCGAPQRNTNGDILRSTEVIHSFKQIHPCPSTGVISEKCPGWALDHVIPLACGGCDAVNNMQWLPNAIKNTNFKYSKDRWERKVYSNPKIKTGSCKLEVIR